jgi:hypothetical protein
MKTENIMQEKSFAFAVRIVKLYQFLCEEKREFTFRDFLAKITISYKEARETVYWLKLLAATGYLNDIQSQSLLADAEEICKIPGKIQITLKKRNS